MNTMKQLACPIAGLVLLLVGNACKPGVSTGPSHLISPEKRAVAPTWALKDFAGNEVQSSDFAGRVVLLDFWATWCPPCREEIPGFVSLQEKFGDKGVTVIGVDVGPEPSETVERFVKRMKINYPILAGSAEIDRAFGGVDAIPTTFVIDQKGRIAGKHVGYTSLSVFENEVQLLVAEGQ